MKKLELIMHLRNFTTRKINNSPPAKRIALLIFLKMQINLVMHGI
jgi:hypothetical protein